ncbi:MAG: response regulator [Anaerolineae bacterium]|nr:response regulator [Anaerolineae bacterium]
MVQRILIVEDEPAVRRVLERALQIKGYEVHTAVDGPSGLGMFQAVCPHLVVLDLMMPKMSGWEVCRRIREMSPVPIIVTTACNTEQDMDRAVEMGADHYLVKPFRPSELQAWVKALLKRAATPVAEETGCLSLAIAT